MLDPIGAHTRIREFWLSYLNTAFRISDKDLSRCRQDLLRLPGTLTTDPYLEPVPRYTQSRHPLEALVTLADAENPLREFALPARTAFVELALAGLFPGEDSGDPKLKRKSRFNPYTHQWAMLERGVQAGKPSIVTSGTGSGKTESFMLPIVAALAREATKWPKPKAVADPTRWFEDGETFKPRRSFEHDDRPKAVRALLLYPMNALVEDQMARLRRAFDSPEAHAVMNDRFNGNRIFFGRYTSASPVTGRLKHPRRSKSKAEQKKVRDRIESLRSRLHGMWGDQEAARAYDAAEGQAGEETRYMFPALDGGELVSRWDMQLSPPDILVTNTSMLATMLVREVEASIWSATRDWLSREPDACFFLVLDELHLIRGSAGAEVVGLLRSLIARLGLNRPELRHKLRILASSASLPTEGADGERTATYLQQFFGSFGTSLREDDSGDGGSARWLDAVVKGIPARESPRSKGPFEADPFAAIVDRFQIGPDPFVPALQRTDDLDNCLRGVAKALGLQTDVSIEELVVEIVSEVSAVLVEACRADDKDEPRATACTALATRLFGGCDERSIRAVQGLCIVRGLTDHMGSGGLYKLPAPAALPSIRVHTFFRSIDGLFASPRLQTGKVHFESPTIERGETHAKGADGEYRRLFELVYCEACGEMYAGGRRSPDGAGGVSELLTTAPNLEGLPERTSDTLYENMAHVEFAMFWPSRAEPKGGSAEDWVPRVLDTRNSLLGPSGDGPFHVPGRLFQTHGNPRAPGSALPKVCPACGTDYSMRKPGMGSLSPLRSFRTGFAKTSQLLATEVFSLLHVSGSAPKSIVFSDSRQDAARAALDIERRHHQDIRRQLLVSEIRKISEERRTATSRRELEERMSAALAAKDFGEVGRLAAALERAEAAGDNTRVALADILEPSAPHDRRVRALMRRHVELGMHPTDPAGVEFIQEQPWYDWLTTDSHGGLPEWLSIDENGSAGRARKQIVDAQRPLTYELLFSKTYFALEETGLGYPSLTASQTGDSDRLDAFLRVLGDSYSVEGNRWSNPAYVHAPSQWPGRVKNFATAYCSSGQDRDAFLQRLLDDLSRLGHRHGVVSLENLYVRLVRDDHAYYRCSNCGRIHLHRGVGYCTRCFTALPPDPSGIAEELQRSNFLARRITRGENEEGSVFRLSCAELTGQTDSPAERLRAFKGMFVEKSDLSANRELSKRAREVDLLSVTTTMEVGIDIGPLQAVYQANMPPQRFNYQQRVGRAGRRGQAFSFVATLCRSRSHDLHYFHRPSSITGDAPPPPFLTSDHRDIALRVIRKAWLVGAFSILRDRDGERYLGDDVTDTHGEFPRAADVLSPTGNWRQKLRGALTETTEIRNQTIDAIADRNRDLAADLRDALGVDATIEAIWKLADDVPRARPLGEFLAEHGLMPMYGMPTRVRPLYLGARRAGSPEAEFSTVDREQDLAIFEFAPGRSLIRDKRRYVSIGFSGTMQAPRDNLKKAFPLEGWLDERRWIAKCPTCGAVASFPEVPAEATPCVACEHPIEPGSYGVHVSPSAFTTSFDPQPVDEGEELLGFRRVVTIEANNVEVTPCAATNCEIGCSDKAKVLRLNEGLSAGADDPKPFAVVEVGSQRVKVGNKTWWDLPGQALLQAEYAELSRRHRAWGPGAPQTVMLMSRKTTDALFLTPASLPAGVELARVGRSAADTAVRAALLSATQLIVQRAALEMDIDPEEFDPLEPRLQSGRPVLQIADYLANGAGFCRRLAENDGRLLMELITSMTMSTARDPLTSGYLDGDHRERCKAACYRCLQRYGNRSYHGLLDWRLGLSVLRLLIDGKWQVGLDGDWHAAPETVDWQVDAERLADDLVRLSPDRLIRGAAGHRSLPCVIAGGSDERFVLVHPFWQHKFVHEKLVADGFGGQTWLIDSFQASRRPQRVLDLARQGELESDPS